MSILRRWAVLLAAITLAPALRAAEPAADAALVKAASAQFDRLRTETLPNGLRVYLLPVPGSPAVTTMVAYKVGAADEDKDQTGLSHYLEHLLFKGTDKLLPGDIDRATQRNGGRNNAYTTEDMTVYHFDFAADRWKIALEIEADRMRNVRIDEKHEFQQEKGAVIAELKGNEDRPWDLEYKAILPMLFPPKSPYAHPVIGEEQHVRAATAEIIKRHYDKWYHPNNAPLVIAGGFDPDEALALVKKLFGDIPKGELPERKTAPEQGARETGAQGVRVEVRRAADAGRVQHRPRRASRTTTGSTWSRTSWPAARPRGCTAGWSKRNGWPTTWGPATRRPLPRLVRDPARTAPGQGPGEGRGDRFRGVGEARRGAGDGRGTAAGPAGCPGVVRLLPRERPRPRRPDRPDGDPTTTSST